MRGSWMVVIIAGLSAINAAAAEPKSAPVAPAAPRLAQPEPVTFEQLSFADEKFRQHARRFHDWGEQLAQPAGKKGLYDAGRISAASNSITYTAWWQSHKENSNARSHDARSLTMRLEGPRHDGIERLNYLGVEARWQPLNEWNSHVSFLIDPRTKGAPRRALVAHASRPGHVNDRGNPIDPVSPYIAVAVQAQPQVRYTFTIGRTKHRDFADSLELLYGKPETMRDELLADLEELRQQARKLLASGGATTVYDERDATSAEPPRETPVAFAQTRPTAATEKALADGVEKQLLALETTLHADYLAIHAAIQKAMPRELLDVEPE